MSLEWTKQKVDRRRYDYVSYLHGFCLAVSQDPAGAYWSVHCGQYRVAYGTTTGIATAKKAAAAWTDSLTQSAITTLKGALDKSP